MRVKNEDEAGSDSNLGNGQKGRQLHAHASVVLGLKVLVRR